MKFNKYHLLLFIFTFLSQISTYQINLPHPQHTLFTKIVTFQIEEHQLNISLIISFNQIPQKLYFLLQQQPLNIYQLKNQLYMIEQNNNSFQITVNKIIKTKELSGSIQIVFVSDTQLTVTILQKSIKRLLYMDNYYNIVYQKIPSYLKINNYLILISVLTNNFQIFIPMMQYNQMFYYLGFLSSELGDMTIFYSNLNSATVDIFTYIKKMLITPTLNPNIPSLLSNANLSISIIQNLLPQLLIGIIILIASIFIKLMTIILKYQFLRKLNFSFKSIWNGYLFILLPKSIFFIGIQFRFFSLTSMTDYINLGVSSFLSLFLILYPIILVFQIRQYIKTQEDKDLKNSVGLINNIDQSKKFQFDCLNYSILYNPVMIYIAQVFFYSGLGFAYDITKIQIGCMILAQFLYFTLFLNQLPYKKKIQNIINLTNNFIILVIICCYISIDISIAVLHPQISSYIQFYSILLYLFGMLLNGVNIVIQLYHSLIDYKQKHKLTKQQQLQIEKTYYMKTAKIQKLNSVKLSSQNQNQQNQTVHDFHQTTHFPIKVKKVRNARIL